jgi:phospholipid/cholesterol/gamma-HCH transport system permease protein
MAAKVGAGQGWLEAGMRDGGYVVSAGGRWDVYAITPLDAQIRGLKPAAPQVTIDISSVERLDTAGAWIFYRTARDWEAAGAEVNFSGASPAQIALLETIERNDKVFEPPLPEGSGVLKLIDHVGAATIDIAKETVDLIGFFGRIIVTMANTAIHPRRLRVTPLLHHMEQVGLNAVPIIGLISFLIGIVLAFQGSSQLQRLGAEVFVVNLVAVSVLREIGILLTAIVIAGRSGSAFTAQIGSMKVNEEIDAMQTLGLDPMEVLVLPRVLALVITLPLLAFFADIMGLLGGGLMSWLALGISPGAFIERLNSAVSMWSFWIGIIKAPVFAFMIAMIGCYEGFQVGGSAESVGQKTTRAVVEAIFLVIIVDALFSIFFQTIGV